MSTSSVHSRGEAAVRATQRAVGRPINIPLFRFGSGSILLVLALLALKAYGVLTWSWLTILLVPVWLPLLGLAGLAALGIALGLVVVVAAVLVLGVVWLYEKCTK